MNMNREVLEEEARKIQEQAKLAQAGLQTMKNLQKCLQHGHTFELQLEQPEYHEIFQMRLVCSTCGAQTELLENIALTIPEDKERFGALESLGLDEIDVEAPEEEPEEETTEPYGFNPAEPSVDNPYDTKKPSQVPEDIMERVKRRYDGETNWL